MSGFVCYTSPAWLGGGKVNAFVIGGTLDFKNNDVQGSPFNWRLSSEVTIGTEILF